MISVIINTVIVLRVSLNELYIFNNRIREHSRQMCYVVTLAIRVYNNVKS